MAAVWIRAPDPGETFLQVSAFQIIMYYIINNWTKEAVLFLIALVRCFNMKIFTRLSGPASVLASYTGDLYFDSEVRIVLRS